MVTRLLIVVLGLVFSSVSFAVNTFVATNGSDSNDCLAASTPCATIQAAVDKTTGKGLVKIAAGTYTGGANIAHFKDITIEGVCGNNNAVLVQVAGPLPGFWVQDNSIGIIGCMKLAGITSGALAIASRQFSIIDYYEMNFADFPNGGHVTAAEMSKVNCGGSIVIYGSAVYHGNASGMSTLSLPCQISLADNPVFTVMLIGSENSFVGAGSTVWIGLAGSCQSYVMQTALIRLNPSYGIPCNQAGAVYYGGQAY